MNNRHDPNRMTGAVVISGKSFALNVVSEIYVREIYQNIQLHKEYDPVPPFIYGSPCIAYEEQPKEAQE